jgi:ribonuclease P protein component
MPRRFGFGKELRVRARREFLAAQRRGTARHTPHFVVVTAKREDPGPPRLGITVTRRVGNAVERNRIKRRVREFFRHHREQLSGSRDYIFIAKSGAENLSYADIVRELSRGTGIARHLGARTPD